MAHKNARPAVFKLDMPYIFRHDMRMLAWEMLGIMSVLPAVLRSPCPACSRHCRL